jgi:hypothetical protein
MDMEYKMKITDYFTDGTQEVRDANESELETFEISKQQAAQRAAQAEAKETARAAAESKLATLGLTVEDLQALGL